MPTKAILKHADCDDRNKVAAELRILTGGILRRQRKVELFLFLIRASPCSAFKAPFSVFSPAVTFFQVLQLDNVSQKTLFNVPFGLAL